MLQRAVLIAAESLHVLEAQLINPSQKQDIRVSVIVNNLRIRVYVIDYGFELKDLFVCFRWRFDPRWRPMMFWSTSGLNRSPCYPKLWTLLIPPAAKAPWMGTPWAQEGLSLSWTLILWNSICLSSGLVSYSSSSCMMLLVNNQASVLWFWKQLFLIILPVCTA